VSDANPPLPGRAREKRHNRLDLVSLESCQQIGEPVDLVQPAADARDISGGRHEIGEAHEGDPNAEVRLKPDTIGESGV
jgi:hypothetical protein